MVYAQQAERFIVDHRITIVAIIAICIMGCIALFKGHDGFFLTAVAVIAGLAGWIAPSPNFLKREVKND